MENNNEGSGELTRRLGFWTATFVVFAGMIGSGIFGNTGIIQSMTNSPALTVFLWFFYGLVALAGALTYAELAARMPHPGGEYVYLRKTFGALPSFLTGWVSFIVGFAAPAAFSSIIAGAYLNEFLKLVAPEWELTVWLGTSLGGKIYACFLLVLLSGVHILGVRAGGYFQNALTAFKLVFVVIFTGAGIYVALNGGALPFEKVFTSGEANWAGAGPGLLMVLYAYSGWNGASYLAGEIKDPEKNVPRALFWGTLITAGLYLLINILYYLFVPVEELSGNQAPAALAASRIFGPNIAAVFKAAFSIILLSSISAQIMVGPRVYYAMAKDGVLFSSMARVSEKSGAPIGAIVFQAVLSIIYVLTGSSLSILIYMGFALNIFPLLTMVSLIKLRLEDTADTNVPYRSPLFPILPVFFILVSVVIMGVSAYQSPLNCLIALVAVGVGVPVFYVWQAFSK